MYFIVVLSSKRSDSSVLWPLLPLCNDGPRGFPAARSMSEGRHLVDGLNSSIFDLSLGRPSPLPQSCLDQMDDALVNLQYLLPRISTSDSPQSVVIMRIVQRACDKLALQSPLYLLGVDLSFTANRISSILENVTLSVPTVVPCTGCKSYRLKGPSVTLPSLPVVAMVLFNYLLFMTPLRIFNIYFQGQTKIRLLLRYV